MLMGMLTLELGVVLRLGDCLPSRALALLFPPIGGMVASGGGDGEHRDRVTEVWFSTTRCDWRIRKSGNRSWHLICHDLRYSIFNIQYSALLSNEVSDILFMFHCISCV